MTIDWFRAECLKFPHATEDVKWEKNLVFSVGDKMFAVCGLETGDTWASFKSSPEEFAELVERPGIRPAPYLARAHWVALEEPDAIPRKELQQLLRRAYDLVFAKLPKKHQAQLN